MSTERQIAANRANAKRSSGPRSRAGKTRASQNAYRHGLAARMEIDADQMTAVNELAREIQSSMLGQIDRAGALVIAQAELEVLRVHRVVTTVFAEMLTGFASHRPATSSQNPKKQAARPAQPGGKPGRTTAGDLAAGIQALKMLNRYMRRGLAKRDRAIRLALKNVSAPFA
jgi:hypothetical protein